MNNTHWDKKESAYTTGLIRALFSTFESNGDGYGCINPVTKEDMETILKETQQNEPKKRTVNRSRNNHSTDHLQLPI